MEGFDRNYLRDDLSFDRPAMRGLAKRRVEVERLYYERKGQLGFNPRESFLYHLKTVLREGAAKRKEYQWAAESKQRTLDAERAYAAMTPRERKIFNLQEERKIACNIDNTKLYLAKIREIDLELAAMNEEVDA